LLCSEQYAEVIISLIAACNYSVTHYVLNYHDSDTHVTLCSIWELSGIAYHPLQDILEIINTTVNAVIWHSDYRYKLLPIEPAFCIDMFSSTTQS